MKYYSFLCYNTLGDEDMKKNIIVILLICFITLGITGCGSNNNKPGTDNKSNNEKQEETASNYKDGMYEWTVGNKTLRTKINVMNYIDGKVWKVNDMAKDLGWDKNKRSNHSKPMTFQKDDTYDVYINFSDGSDHCGAIIIKGDNRKPIILYLPQRDSDDYTFNDNDFTMSIEGIVSFAYACEQLTENPDSNPFDGLSLN